LPYTSFKNLKNLGLETLARRRLVHHLIFIYKILHGLCDVSLSITFTNSSTRGNSFKLVKPSCHCDCIGLRYIAIANLPITAVFVEYLRQFLTDLNQIYRHSSEP